MTVIFMYIFGGRTNHFNLLGGWKIIICLFEIVEQKNQTFLTGHPVILTKYILALTKTWPKILKPGPISSAKKLYRCRFIGTMNRITVMIS